MTNGRLIASHGKAIGGGLWLHLFEASRRDARESGNDVGRIRSGGDVMLVGLRVGLELEGDFEGVVTIGFEEGLGLGLEDESDDVGSVERVVRFVDFVGDSTGGGKSLG